MSVPGARVAVIHDWLTGMRGGEQVLEGILDVLPEAELFTLFHFPGSVSSRIESRPIHTSMLQPLATRIGDYRKLLPLFPAAVRRWDLSGFDLIVSSSHCAAKAVNARGKPHLCYCHTPMRYIWDRFDDYFPRTNPVRRLAARRLARWLRRWDVSTARQVTRFVANSKFVAGRIASHYGREAEVIYPFVDDAFLQPPLSAERDDYHLVVSALVPYKKVELAVEAAVAAGRRLVVIGGGPMLRRLSLRGAPNVEFLGSVQRSTIVERLSRAQSLILPGIEDFGITPLEAMALGTPVVAQRGGGAVETVVEGRTGIFFDGPSVEALRRAMEAVERRSWDRAALREHAAAFSRARFSRELSAAITRVQQS